MIADQLQGIEKFEADLWKIADNLRANSNLASNEYFMPIMGLIFLRHATNRFYEAKSAIEADKAAGKMPDRPLVEADFTRRRALNLPESARFDIDKTPSLNAGQILTGPLFNEPMRVETVQSNGSFRNRQLIDVPLLRLDRHLDQFLTMKVPAAKGPKAPADGPECPSSTPP
jgi:hypothetical protein